MWTAGHGVMSAILNKVGLCSDGLNLEFYKHGGILIAGYKQRDMVYNQSATALWPVGTKLILGDEIYYYAKAGGALVAGELAQTAANGGATTAQQDCTVAVAGAVGGSTVSVTIKVDTLTANQFKNGHLIVSDGSAAQGCGQTFRIKSHPAGSGNVVITCYDKFPVTISTSAKVTLMANKYLGVIQAPVTTATGAPAGVPRIAVTSAYYHWLQTWGPCAVLATNAGITVGHPAVRGLAVAGAIMNQVGTAEDENVIGDILMSGDATDHVLIDLKIAA